ncbi:MAG: hypothetical protein GY832_11610 [Chloroflexi bacterium]|nr:hypothetical protein [Chloroflexota bacterium]
MPTLNDPNGTACLVSGEGRLAINGVAQTPARHMNIEHGETFTVLVDVTSATTDDDFFYLKNNEDEDLVIYKIEGWCDDANQEIKVVLGATDAGTAAGDTLTPVAMNAGSGVVPDVTCTQDATDLAITGGSVATLLKFNTVALQLASWYFQGGIVIPKNKRLHMEAALAGLINLNIYFYFDHTGE